MRILLLSPPRPAFEEYLQSLGDEIQRTEEDLIHVADLLGSSDYLISYGYRHMVRKDVLTRMHGRAINLHISFLPWNRGADPNLWSFLENSLKGVTIHQIDTGLDTGEILAQTQVPMDSDDTLRSSYERLTDALEELFRSSWPQIRSGSVSGRPQDHRAGTVHRIRDRERFASLLVHGWDTPVAKLIGKARTGATLRDDG